MRHSFLSLSHVTFSIFELSLTFLLLICSRHTPRCQKMFFSCSLPESCNLFSYIKQHADFPFFIPAPPSLFCKAFKKYNQERRRRLLWSHFYYPPAPFSDHFTFSLTILESFHRERQVTAFLKELPPCLVCVKTRGTLQTPQRRRSAGR